VDSELNQKGTELNDNSTSEKRGRWTSNARVCALPENRKSGKKRAWDARRDFGTSDATNLGIWKRGEVQLERFFGPDTKESPKNGGPPLNVIIVGVARRSTGCPHGGRLRCKKKKKRGTTPGGLRGT